MSRFLEKDLQSAFTETPYESREDQELVVQAQAGDREAFGELVRRHRAKLYGYVHSVTQEAFLAEDIVQDALIRAFLHLGTLMDTQRFLPWLHRIVRNQAYTKLRASWRQAKEQTFSQLRAFSGRDQYGETDWFDLDSILHRLSQRVNETSAAADHPEEALMRKELFTTIENMLHCLSPRERKIVESTFFDHLSPAEISRLFQLSPANVYQILSRSKKKLVHHKTVTAVDQYLKDRKDMGKMSKNVLANKHTLTPENGTWTSAAWALHVMLSHTEKTFSLPTVMGLSGHAFRINLVEGDIHIAGPTMYDMQELLGRGLQHLGYQATSMFHHKAKETIAPNANLVDPYLLTPEASKKRELAQALPEALELIHRSIDRGYPVVAFDLFIPEFGVIYGYDDEKQVLFAADPAGHDKELPFEHLGRGIIEELFVLAIDCPVSFEWKQSVRHALQMAIDHYRGKDMPLPGCVNGLDAYDAWISAFQAGTIEPNGNSYNLAVVQDARVLGARFLDELSQREDVGAEDMQTFRTLCQEAADLCRVTAGHLKMLCNLFPFPAGGNPNDASQSTLAVELLQQAKRSEQETVAKLQDLLTLV